VSDPDVASNLAEGLENVIGQALTFFERGRAVDGIPHEHPGVRLSAVLQKVRPVAEVTNHRATAATDRSHAATHAAVNIEQFGKPVTVPRPRE
jgi:hypothetical protein